jgi:NADH:ubiquinone oxidoreductase subunit E
VETKQATTQETLGQDEFTQEELAAVDGVIGRYQNKAGSLIPVLEEIQETIGHLPKSIQRRVAVVPRGRHTTRCCLGTACYVRGGKRNMEKLTEMLNVSPGETTSDRRFSLETVRCLGACGLAPVIMVDDDTYRQVKPTKIPEILDTYE